MSTNSNFDRRLRATTKPISRHVICELVVHGSYSPIPTLFAKNHLPIHSSKNIHISSYSETRKH